MASTRVQRSESEGALIWRKSYSDGGRRRRIALLRWIARRLGANALLAPIPLDAAAACRTEQAMIRRLAALDVRVPVILQAGERELLLSDLGPTLSRLCRRESCADAREALIARGFAALLDLHRRGGYVSQAFARNVTLGDGMVGFIDLEEDPVSVMSLAAAQARDVLFYAHSTARFLVGRPGAHANLLSRHLAAESTDVQAEVMRTVTAIAWLAPLVRLFGRRAREVAEGVTSLHQAAASVRPGTDAGQGASTIIPERRPPESR